MVGGHSQCIGPGLLSFLLGRAVGIVAHHLIQFLCGVLCQDARCFPVSFGTYLPGSLVILGLWFEADILLGTMRGFFAAIRTILGRMHWVAGVITTLSLITVRLIYGMMVPKEYGASAVLKLEFLGTNSAAITAADYATNYAGYRWLCTETRLIQSEVFVGRALQRLKSGSGAYDFQTGVGGRPSPIESVVDHLGVQIMPKGIRIRLRGNDRQGVADLVNALAETCVEEQNEMAAVPPGCRKLVVTIDQRAQPARHVVYGPLLRFTFGAILLGVAIAIRRGKQLRSAEPLFVRSFLFWSSLSCSSGVLVTDFSTPLCFVGATIIAFLTTGATGWVFTAASKDPPVPRKFLKVVFGVVSIVMVCFAVLSNLLETETPMTGARVRVSLKRAQTADELPSSYNPYFLATECALIRSSAILSALMDEHSRKSLAEYYGHPFTEGDVWALRYATTVARPIEDTALIDIFYPEVTAKGQQSAATRIAERYREYWNARSKTNAAYGVQVTVLNSAITKGARRLSTQGRYAREIVEQVLSALFVLAGAICAALLAKNPPSLYLLVASAVAFVLAAAFAALLFVLLPDTYTSRALVRIWSPSVVQPGAAQSSPPKRWSSRGECRFALSEEVLGRAIVELQSDPNFSVPQHGTWDRWSQSQRLDWLKEHLQIYPLEDTYLIAVAFTSDGNQNLAAVANAVAASYCETHNKLSQNSPHFGEKLRMEVMDPAKRPIQPDKRWNPVMAGLAFVSSDLVAFGLGAVMGYFGFLLEKYRRAKIGMGAAETT